MRAAVVGHVEWVDFVRVERVPDPGEIVHALDAWQEPGGGGSGAVVQLQKLTGDATFYTALGDDDLGHRTHAELTRRDVRMEAVFRPKVTRRAVTHVDADGERTITVVGERLAPSAGDPLRWDDLDDVDAAYFTAGDVAAVRAARRARVLVATSRILPLLAEAAIELDALVGSALDSAERYQEGDLDPAPRLVVRTEGDKGGTFQVRGEETTHYDPSPLPGPIVDRYGAGDSFAGALAYALASGRSPGDAVSLAGRCGAAVLTGRGPYEGQLHARDLEELPRR